MSNQSNQIVAGSLGALAKQQNQSLAETFVNCDCVVIVDTSGSMHSQDSRGGRSRYDVACDELRQLQANLPGKIGVIAFSNHVMFCPGGQPVDFGGGTDLERALKFTKIADVPGMRFIVISDGDPDDREAALKIAATYQNRIDVIYVGPESMPAGRDFLAQLAKVSGGQAITADRAQELSKSVQFLLTGG